MKNKKPKNLKNDKKKWPDISIYTYYYFSLNKCFLVDKAKAKYFFTQTSLKLIFSQKLIDYSW